jgi:hypothetical protein
MPMYILVAFREVFRKIRKQECPSRKAFREHRFANASCSVTSAISPHKLPEIFGKLLNLPTFVSAYAI